MSARILVSDNLSEEGLAKLRAAGFEVIYNTKLTKEELDAILPTISGWLVRSATKVTAEAIGKAPLLRVVGRAGVGVDNVDAEAATARGVVVMNTPGGNTISTAEHTIAMMLSLARHIPDAVASMREGKWDRKSFTGVEIEGKTVGVVGLGRIGQEVIKRLRAFGCHILGFDPHVTDERVKRLGAEPVTVEDMVPRADILTVHAPLTPETRDIIDARQLARMKKSALIVNCARGGIINEAALADALRQGLIAGAAVDVYEVEPLPADNPLRGAPRLLATPHIAASTNEAQELVAVQVAEQVIDFLRFGIIKNAVNAPSVDAEQLETLRPFLTLAEKLGAFVAQFAGAPVKRFEIEYFGGLLDHALTPVTIAAEKGFLLPTTDTMVNDVNAMNLMKARGIDVLETRHSEPAQFSNLIRIRATQQDGRMDTVAGTVFEGNRPRIVQVNDKFFDAHPVGHVLVIENRDVPGIIGAVASVLGSHGINIGQMTWGRTEKDGTALTVINLDAPIRKDVLAEIRALSNILSVKTMDLS